MEFKYFLNIAFVREISSKLSGGCKCYRHELVKTFSLHLHILYEGSKHEARYRHPITQVAGNNQEFLE